MTLLVTSLPVARLEHQTGARKVMGPNLVGDTDQVPLCHTPVTLKNIPNKGEVQLHSQTGAYFKWCFENVNIYLFQQGELSVILQKRNQFFMHKIIFRHV